MDEYKRFQTDLADNQVMQGEVKEIATDVEAVIKYANKKGYDFTFKDIEPLLRVDVELSEDDLDQVAGGSSNVVISVVMGISAFVN
jgi:predicted ribosomally synthesized peptide with nif11-like leader